MNLAVKQSLIFVTNDSIDSVGMSCVVFDYVLAILRGNTLELAVLNDRLHLLMIGHVTLFCSIVGYLLQHFPLHLGDNVKLPSISLVWPQIQITL